MLGEVPGVKSLVPVSGSMTPQLWIGFGFLALIVVFLMITFFKGGTLTPGQYNTLRFLTALCAGFAGGFLTGDALFRWEQDMASGAKFGISGAAGCALFFTIWFTYPPLPPPDNRLILSIPAGWTFQQAVLGIAKAARRVAQLEGFQPQHLALPLPATDIDAPDALQAMLQLRFQSTQLPDFQVEYRNGVYHIHV
jgi:hypothetical protein